MNKYNSKNIGYIIQIDRVIIIDSDLMTRKEIYNCSIEFNTKALFIDTKDKKSFSYDYDSICFNTCIENEFIMIIRRANNE